MSDDPDAANDLSIPPPYSASLIDPQFMPSIGLTTKGWMAPFSHFTAAKGARPKGNRYALMCKTHRVMPLNRFSASNHLCCRRLSPAAGVELELKLHCALLCHALGDPGAVPDIPGQLAAGSGDVIPPGLAHGGDDARSAQDLGKSQDLIVRRPQQPRGGEWIERDEVELAADCRA